MVTKLAGSSVCRLQRHQVAVDDQQVDVRSNLVHL